MTIAIKNAEKAAQSCKVVLPSQRGTRKLSAESPASRHALCAFATLISDNQSLSKATCGPRITARRNTAQKKRKGGEVGKAKAKAQGIRGWKPHKTGDNEGEKNKKSGGAWGKTTGRQGTRLPGPENKATWRHRGWRKAGERKRKKRNKEKEKQTQTGQSKPGGGRSNEEHTNNGRRKGGANHKSPGRPALLTLPKGEHTHTHTHGTPWWHPPSRKRRCRRQHQTAPVHRPSPSLKDRRHGKPDV